MLVNHADTAQPILLIPDGRIDVFFAQPATEPYQVTLRGLDTQPSAQVIPPHRSGFTISWKLLAAEYPPPIRLAGLLESGCPLPPDYLAANSRTCKPPSATASSRCAGARL
nr:hypothetical protein [Hymenobacter rubidus]